ncbi:MAG: transketolase [Bacteroidetes bacterium]|nr:MAG: transketolase [Bacteroidota bacterium]
MDKIIGRSADNIRILSAAMVEKANSGHPGGAMGGADFINILYSEFLNFDPDNGKWRNRDRFFLDPGHMSPMLYSILLLAGYYKMEDIENFRQWASITPGHPEVHQSHGVENTSGPLGMGHTNAVGAAISERFLVARFGDIHAHKTYAFISDGGIQEEISQGAGRTAGYLGLNNLIMFYDSNDIQLSTETNAVSHEDTAMKYRAWGWNVMTIEGNDPHSIREALKNAHNETERPTLIIGKTIMGKGAVTEEGKSFERQVSTHGQPLSGAGASFAKTIENLGGNSENPFVVFEDVQKFWDDVKARKREHVKNYNEQLKKWETDNPELAQKLDFFYSGKAPEIDFSAIEQKKDIASRAASGTILGHLAEKVENMIVASADLSNSDKTDGFLKKTTQFKKGDFSGAFLQAGVSELTMAAMANGMALHGGVIPVCGTFFVFSDYMKPAVRLAALMELPVIYVWTHDAFRVGEDGPTHQPIEQEAQLRLLEQMKNHSGIRCFLALRPADAMETNVAWKMALNNNQTPTALILSRQNIPDLPAKENRYKEALGAEKGGYVVDKDQGNIDIVLVGNGSEVATLYAGAQLLREKKDLKVQVSSVISEGLFREQSAQYQEEVIPSGLPIMGLTAGLPSTLAGLVGPKGKSIGMEGFGYSAPAKVLDEKLGYTAENVYKHATAYLGLA